MTNWIQTFSGKMFFPLAPRAQDIDIEDIAHALSNLCRFGGHTKAFYSVAQHSCLIADALSVKYLNAPEAERRAILGWALLHDAAEAYLVDIPRPIKYAEGMERYRDWEVRLECAIAERFSLPPVMPAIVKEYDNRILRNEADALLGQRVNGWAQDVVPLPEVFIGTPWRPVVAKREFLRHFSMWVA